MNINQNKWKYTTYSDVNPEVKQYFPFSKARKGQLELTSEIRHAIDNGYKFIVLEAGTGTGKSVIAATLALMAENAYILTMTKQLQDQYLNDFKSIGFRLIKGKGNYPCMTYIDEGISESCEFGKCVLQNYNCKYKKNLNNLEDCLKDDCCIYRREKSIALHSDVVITNYSYANLELNNSSDFTKRELIVCDEAHNLETQLMSVLSLELSRKELKEDINFNLSKEIVYNLQIGDYLTWINFIQEITNKYENKKDELEKLVSYDNVSLTKFYKIIKSKIAKFYEFLELIEEYPENWVFDYNKKSMIASFKPITIDNYARKLLFNHCDSCLFMSATILDYEQFAKWLGISKSEIYPIRMKSPFDVSRNPIKTCDVVNLSYTKLKENSPKTIPVIKKILNAHKNDKGIIHTISYDCKDFIMNNLHNSRLIDHNTSNRTRILREFEESDKPLVLVSPSMNEGVDLPGDKCRFQIIYKIPYPNISDKQVMIRKEMDNMWYDYKTVINLIQTYGRGMRSENDYCKTYFIDNRLKDYVIVDDFTYNFIPDFFKKAINIGMDDLSKSIEEHLIALGDDRKINSIIDNSYEVTTLDDFEKVDLYHDYDTSKSNEAVLEKFELIQAGKDLIFQKRYDEASEYFCCLTKHKYFINDYYPYRQLVIIYEKIKDYKSLEEIIFKFLKSGIYCNNHNYLWFMIKLKRFSEINDNIIQGYEEYFKLNSLKNKYKSNTPVVIAERIKGRSCDELYLLSEKEYDEIQKAYELEEIGRYLERNNEFTKAIEHYLKVIKDLKYYSYTFHKQLCIDFRKIREYNREMEIIEDYFKNPKVSKTDYSDKWFKDRLLSLKKIKKGK